MEATTPTTTTAMPRWNTESEMDPSWLQNVIQPPKGNKIISKCLVQDISNDTRKGDTIQNGATLLLQLTFDDKTSTTLVAKQAATNSGKDTSRSLGLAREALFYTQLAPKLGDSSCGIPKIYYAFGDMSDGSKCVIMEDLSKNFIDSGILFGPGNPNNWNRDLPSRIAASYPNNACPSSFEVANETFLTIAKVHATFWKDTSLLAEEFSWLRGSTWINGTGQDSWQASQGMLQTMWKQIQGDVDSRIEWDPLVKKILAKAMDGISWESQRKRLNANRNFCLVHGDFWPGNIMISTTDRQDLRLIDWEMVGLGSGPQDLGQYILSNMEPSQRRDCEKELVRNYYNKLIELGVIGFSWDECWSEYTIGGLERWLWFLVYFCAQSGPLLQWAQFFHNQMKEFVHDHQIVPEDVTQPRP